MIKKICLIIYLTLLVVSCGKKSDPIYQEKTGLIKIKVYGTTDIVVV